MLSCVLLVPFMGTEAWMVLCTMVTVSVATQHNKSNQGKSRPMRRRMEIRIAIMPSNNSYH